MNPEDEPEGGREMLRDMFAEASHSTGFVFVEDGVTTEQAPEGSGADRFYQPDRYGDRWSPVLVTWRPMMHTKSGGVALGYGGRAWANHRGEAVSVTGTIRLNATALGWMIQHGQLDKAEAVVLHEIGHVLGLSHSKDEDSLMLKKLDGEQTRFSYEDQAGLALLASGPCRPDL